MQCEDSLSVYSSGSSESGLVIQRGINLEGVEEKPDCLDTARTDSSKEQLIPPSGIESGEESEDSTLTYRENSPIIVITGLQVGDEQNNYRMAQGTNTSSNPTGKDPFTEC